MVEKLKSRPFEKIVGVEGSGFRESRNPVCETVDPDISDEAYRALFEPHYKLVRKKKYKKAVSLLLTPDNTIRPELESFPNHVWYCVGTVYFSMGDFVEAISCLKRALQDWPGDIQAWIALGNSYSEQKCFQEASHCFFSAMVLDPSHSDAVFNYAAALIDLGQYEKAKHFLESLEERTETVLRQIAFCEARLGL